MSELFAEFPKVPIVSCYHPINNIWAIKKIPNEVLCRTCAAYQEWFTRQYAELVAQGNVGIT